MSIRTSRWPVGMPCWVDLNVPDVAAAKGFYADVLGWTYQDTEAEYGGYAVAEAHGAAAGGIGPQQQTGPTAWTLYLAADDADGTAAAISENGGTVILPPGDVGPLGRMVLAADPTSARFGVWQAGTHIGAGVVNEPGGLTWEDLRSPDPDASRRFYNALFGYRFEPQPDAGPDYTTFALPDDDAPLGGMGGLTRPSDESGHWVVYFGVADTAAAVAAAARSGGSVLVPNFRTPYGVMAGLADPSGSAFFVVEADAAGQPDRSG